jgi:hypothetical protein
MSERKSYHLLTLFKEIRWQHVVKVWLGLCRRQVSVFWYFGVELDEGMEERRAETHPDITLDRPVHN